MAIVINTRHEDIFLLRIDVLNIILIFVIVVAGEVGFPILAHLGLPLSSFAQDAGTVGMRQGARSSLVVGAVTFVSKVRTFDNMPLVTSRPFGTITEGGESSADGCRGRDGDVRVAACSVCAVATKKELAGGDAVVAHIVRHVAVGTTRAGASFKKVSTNGDFCGVVEEVTLRAVGTGTCERYQFLSVVLTDGPFAMSI